MVGTVKLPPRRALAGAVAAVLVVAMAVDTKVVRIGSPADVQADVFSPAKFGASEFSKVQAAVESKAVDAAALATAIGKDQDAAAKQYGVPADAGSEIPVKFTGKVSGEDSGVCTVTVPGVPDGTQITVQTGPAIIGTDLRDVTGTITFGQFRNQIEYQNAGAALNTVMKQQVLSKIDTSKLTGKTISVVGVLLLTDPGNWVVTPVQLTVQ
ncbi:DUF2291 family protein [Lichenicola sp.]|uniref:DUF2291 family protein n=1 Tax=Lichenicola sp. TaxID=2804529 RepID=UPI003AFFA9BA